MLIPILFVVGLALVGVKLGQKLQPSDFRVGAALPAPKLRSVSYVQLINVRIARGQPVSDWLVCEATREAFDRGDWATVRHLCEVFDVPAATNGAEPAPEKQETKPEAPTTSPLDGIEPEDWQAFCSALENVSHGSDRCVGRYGQNIKRLRQLGLESPTSSDEEYKALVADMSDYWDSEQKLVADYTGNVVALNGREEAVTASGVLGLLKAAGPQGARSWLENDQDRARFPKTTETFLRTNGCF